MGDLKRHNYEYAVNVEAQTAPAKVVRMVGNDKRVLEIGAGPGSITKMLQQNNCRITGVEVDSTAIEKLIEFCEKVHQCDLNAPNWSAVLDDSGKFDVLVAADVFEHLYWPQQSLKALKPFFAENGYLVVSLPHVGNNAIVASILSGDFEYRDWGLLDRTHIRFFGLKNMQDLFEQAGYKIIAAEFVVNPPEQTELASHWLKLPKKVKTALEVNTFGNVYQVVMKIVPTEFDGVAIRLTNIAVPSYASSLKARAVAWVRPHISPKFRQFIKRFLPN
ncbi:MAG: class I SAM-dependent methyltransferase [Methylophilaceae bacterium]